jgi:hypothetical protein
MATDTAGRPTGQADAGGAGAPAARGPARRLLVGGGWAAATLAAFAVYLRLASTRGVNSDGASIALAAWDMLHGNLLLRGWKLADVTFYTTEVPQYALIELVHGLNQNVVRIGAAMSYTLVLLFVALVAKGRTTGWSAAARVAIGVGIMLAPQLASGTNVLVSSPDHIGTSVPLLLILLILDRVRRPRWWVPVVVSALLAWSELADSVVLLAGAVPLIAVCAFRVCAFRPADGERRFASRWYEVSLAGGAVVAVGVADAAYRIIHALGGYTERPLGTQLAPLSEIFGHNLPIAAQCLLLLPGADFLGLPADATTFFIALHLVGVAAAAAAIALAARRFHRRDADLVAQLLVAGIVVNFVAFVVTTHVYFVASAREIAPLLPFAAVLAGRELAPYLRAPQLRARHLRAPRYRRAGFVTLGVILAGYLAGLGLELTAPTAPPLAAPLTAWLESHPIGTGLSGYWQANVVALTSGGRVAVHPIQITDGRVVPMVSQVKTEWFDPAVSRVDFVVMFPGVTGYPGFTDRQAVLATFGKPSRTYHVGQYTILWWPKNLLPDIHDTP